MGKPFLQAHHRFKDGKDHVYWSIVEKLRTPRGDWVQRPILYLGEMNDSQKAAWIKTIEVFDSDRQAFTQLALFPSQREVPAQVADAVQVRLSEFRLERPRQWGACWVACRLWQQLNLDGFWSQRLEATREGTDWKRLLEVLTIYRLLDPGSEWRLHRQWWAGTALDELLGLHLPVLDKDSLYRTLPEPENTAVMGSSMGGLISFLFTWWYPEVFGKAACLSSVFDRERTEVISLVEAEPVRRDRFRVYMDCGGAPGEVSLKRGMEEMVDVLQKRGYRQGKDFVRYFDPVAGHNEQAWASRLWRPMEFLFAPTR